MFSLAALLVSILAGGVAAISGFGVGSLLTPLFAPRFGTKLAIAIVSVPHLVATAARFLGLRQYIDRRVFLNFGIASALGGLLGALLNSRANSPALAIVLGSLLIFAGISGLSGLASHLRFGRTTAWFAGALSGLFGGLVGNQGGIRSAALIGFEVRKQALVATATASALIVDAARMPVYFAVEGSRLLHEWPVMAVATTGVLLGTFAGVRILRQIPEKTFTKLLSLLITALGIYMLVHGFHLRGANE